jgi:hypothetical protein
VSDTVLADSLKGPFVSTPVLLPIPHVVIALIVDGAGVALAG